MPNISRSKSNQAIVFGQLIECNMRNFSFFCWKIMLKIWCRIYSQTFFCKKSKFGISQSIINRLYSLFLLYVQAKGSWNVLKISCKPFVFIWYKASLENKKSSGTSLRLFFCMVFEEKSFSLYILLTEQISLSGFPGCDIDFKVNLIFLIKPSFCVTKKLRQKIKYLENEKIFWNEIKKNIFHHF